MKGIVTYKDGVSVHGCKAKLTNRGIKQVERGNKMDMPCNCPECGEVVELNDMYNTEGKLCYHSMVCEDCYENLESNNLDCKT